MQPTATPKMSGDEALKVLAALQASNDVTPEKIEAKLAEIRGATGVSVRAVTDGQRKKELSPEDAGKLFATLKTRFEAHQERHGNVQWTDVEKALRARPDLMVSMERLEATGGEPDVFAAEGENFLFGDCSQESPAGRRNVVFDKAAQDWLATNRSNEECAGNAVDISAGWGVDLMNDPQYRALQELGKFDSNTWSYLKTPPDMRSRGLALYGDRRGDDVVVDESGATVRDDYGGFRCVLRVPKI